MKRSLLILSLAALTTFLAPAAPAQTAPSSPIIDFSLAPTPPMGWNSWNTFASKIDEDLIKGVADTMVSNGMRDAGYIYVNIDDCWLEKKRDAEGNLVADAKKFPSGMKALGDYLHARGLKFGIYNDAGTETCAGYPGGKDHEEQDAKTYASWGVDYLKYDWCKTTGQKQQEYYPKMARALVATGRPIVFSMCEWGQSKPWEWATGTAHLWRTTGDIEASYNGKGRYTTGWKNILDMQAKLAPHAGPGHWNDPDMLEVGVGKLTLAESRAHFSLWCMLAAPLIAGNDIRKMKPEIHDILVNRDVIAIDQDPLGKQGTRFDQSPDGTQEIWIKELSKGDWAICLLNTSKEKRPLTLDWKACTFLKGAKFTIRDLWAAKDLGTTETPFSAEVETHDVSLLRLTPAK